MLYPLASAAEVSEDQQNFDACEPLDDVAEVAGGNDHTGMEEPGEHFQIQVAVSAKQGCMWQAVLPTGAWKIVTYRVTYLVS